MRPRPGLPSAGCKFASSDEPLSSPRMRRALARDAHDAAGNPENLHPRSFEELAQLPALGHVPLIVLAADRPDVGFSRAHDDELVDAWHVAQKVGHQCPKSAGSSRRKEPGTSFTRSAPNSSRPPYSP